MRSTLFHIPTQIAGLPLFGEGILYWTILGVGLLAVVRGVLQRKSLSDVVFYALITALGMALMRFVAPSLLEADGFPIRGYGVFLTIAIAAAGSLALWRGKKLWNIPTDLTFTLLLVAAIFGIVGARCFYVVQYWREFQCESFAETLVSAINVANGGLVVYGSIIGGAIAAIVFLLVKKIPVVPILDLLAPSLMLGIAIGRLGCFMNGCCFGGICDLPWAVSFPPGSPAYVQQLDEGKISLYGITLASPDANTEEKTLFSLKSKHVNLASETPSDVVVAAVDPSSAAEDAGIKPGDKILELGVAPKGFLTSSEVARDAFAQRKISRFRAANNAQVFYFFLNIWDENSDDDVWLVLQNPEDKTETGLASARNVVFHPTHSKAKPVHPTQIYSSINAFVICGVLLIVSRFVKRDGVLAGLTLVLYPVNRFCLELLRVDEESFYGAGLTISQCVSLVVVIFGIGLLIWSLTRPPRRALDGLFPEETRAADVVAQAAPK